MGNATFYQIKEMLTPCSAEEIFCRKPGDPPYVVIMDPETWGDLELDEREIRHGH